MSDYVIEIAQDQFEANVLASEVPVALDFYSTECPPCEALAPKYTAVAEQLAGQVKFYKIYRQGNRDLSTRLGVSGSPTVVFFKAGKEVGERLTGEIKRSDLKQAAQALVG